MKLNKNETAVNGYSLMNDARYISCFAGIKKSNTIEEINSKLTNLFELIKKYNVSVNDTFNILEEVIGNDNNKWIIDEVYNYSGRYNINDLYLSRYIGEMLYSSNNELIDIDKIYKTAVNLRRVILDSVFNKIKGLIVGQFTEYQEDNKMYSSLYDSILSAVKEFDFPVCFGFPVGHTKINLPIVIGAKATLTIKKDTVLLKQRY